MRSRFKHNKIASILPLAFTDPKEIDAAKPDEKWQTSDGRVMLVKDMESKHIMNSMRVLENRVAGMKQRLSIPNVQPAAIAEEMFPVYENMKKELERRIKKQWKQEPTVSHSRKFKIEKEEQYATNNKPTGCADSPKLNAILPNAPCVEQPAQGGQQQVEDGRGKQGIESGERDQAADRV